MPEILGTPGNDNLTGTDGQDIIDGLAGDDQINGGGDWDELDGGLGNDVVHGGDDTDFIHFGNSEADSPQHDELYGEAGNDFLQAFIFEAHADTLIMDGGVGDDLITFDSRSYTQTVSIFGGDGSDRISIQGGQTLSLDAGSGDDRIYLIYSHSISDYRLELGSGADQVVFRMGESYLDAPAEPLRFSDFEAGLTGDRISFDIFLVMLDGWDRTSNPVASGHLSLVQRGPDTVLLVDFNGGGDAFHDFLVFEGLAANSLVDFNLGFAPDGGDSVDLVLTGSSAANLLLGSGGEDQLQGMGGDDEILGGAGDDELEGDLGDDRLTGGFGDDVVRGGDGNDDLSDFYGGNDQFFGDGGNDLIEIDRSTRENPASILVDGGAGNDELRYSVFNNQRPDFRYFDDVTLVGGEGNDSFTSFFARTTTIDAGDGADTLYLANYGTFYTISLGAGSDRVTLEGFGPGGLLTFTDFQTGLGGDYFELARYLGQVLDNWDEVTHPFATGHLSLVQQGNDVVLRIDVDGTGAEAAVDRFVFQNVDIEQFAAFNFDGFGGSFDHEGTAGADRLFGAWGANTLWGLGGDDVLEGGAGDDILDGGTGQDRMVGGAGNDTYRVDTPSDTIVDSSGHDTVESAISYTLGGTIENLTLLGAAPINGTGNRRANAIVGNYGTNTLSGSLGNDALHGREGSDTLDGGDGNDLLNGGIGADTMLGGLGDDVFVADNGLDRAVEAAGGGLDRVESSVSFTLGVEVENLTLSGASAVNGTGNTLDNRIVGNGAANILNGSAGNDILRGELGNDTYIVDNVGDQAVEASAAGGLDLVQSSVSFTLGAYVENLTLTGTAAINATGNGLANLLTGNGAANVLDGKAGADEMRGGAGNDSYIVDNAGDQAIEISASHGVDTVSASVSYTLAAKLENLTLTGTGSIDGTGNAGSNVLTGNVAKNFLDGGAGSDTLFGGGGADRFVFANSPSATNVDTVLDFAPGVDKLLLDDAVFTALGAGALPAGALVMGSAATDASDRILYDAATGALFYDRDGTGAAAAVQFATLDNLPASLAASDFMVI